MTCHLADRDGSYVLGALSPAERLEFEEHLPGCAACSQSVREIAGLPGLLAGVDRSVLEAPAADDPVPETLLPRLLRDVRRSRRRRWLETAGAAASAAAVVALGFVVAGPGHGDPVAGDRPTTGVSVTAAPVQAMTPVDGAPVRATVSLASAAWGTRLNVSCTYLGSSAAYHLPRVAHYAIVVRSRQGRTEQVGAWTSDAGRTMRLAAATSVPRHDIASVEVRTPDGHPVLRLTS